MAAPFAWFLSLRESVAKLLEPLVSLIPPTGILSFRDWPAEEIFRQQLVPSFP